MYPFRNGPDRKPKPTVEGTPRVAAPPHRGVAREDVTVTLDGVEHVLTIIRQPRIHGSEGYWLCPRCSALDGVEQPRWHLYVRGGEIGCRKCFSLTYLSRRTRHGAALRARKIRRRLGAAPGLLSALPARPKHWRRDYWARALRELAQVEGVLAAKLHDMVRR